MVSSGGSEHLTYGTEEIAAAFPETPRALNQLPKLWERSARKKCHPMACLGVSSPRHCGCHWPSWGQTAGWVFIHLFPADLFSVSSLLLRANPLLNNKGKTPGRCMQEKGIAARIAYVKSFVHGAVWEKKRKKVHFGTSGERVHNWSGSQLWVCKLPVKKCGRELCLPASSPYLCNQIIPELLEAETCEEDGLHAKRNSPGKSQYLNNRNTDSAAWDTVSHVDILRAGWLLPLPGRSVCKLTFVVHWNQFLLPFYLHALL